MSQPHAISVQNVSKVYRIWETPLSRLTAPLLEAAAGLLPVTPGQWLKRRTARSYRDFWALKDISFEVKKGESVGIIGRNGSGKSTLLQIIAGILRPTHGGQQVAGRVAALLELGSGFNPEFTGRENVHLNGAVLGLSRREVEARFADIASFADIGDFIDRPVKTYSSGMMIRLAFAVQTAVEPEILIVDEALSVGDFFFQQKCFARIAALRARGTTLLFVSHDMGSVRDLCERTLYLKGGRGEFWGSTQEAIAAYLAEGTSTPTVALGTSELDQPHACPTEFLAKALWRAETSPGESTAPGRLLGVALLDGSGQAVVRARIGQTLRWQVLFRATRAGRYHVVVELKNRYDQVATSISSYTCGLPPLGLAAGQAAILELEVELRLEAGPYSCQAVLASEVTQPNRATRYDVSPWLGPIEITWNYEQDHAPFLGMFGPVTRARFIL